LDIIANRTPPVNIIDSDNLLFSHEYNRLFMVNEVVKYNKYNISTVTESVEVRTKGDMIIYIWGDNTPANSSYVNYFHWFCDIIPKLELLLTYVDAILDYVIVMPIGWKGLSYVVESIGKYPFRVKYYDPSDSTEIYTNVLCVSTLIDSGNYIKSFMCNIRDRFSSTTNNPSDKIYIGRRVASRRFMVNEDSIISCLSAYGYRTVYFEDFVWEDQVSMMQNAASVISLHGAGLTNMLWMPSGGSVVEIRVRGDSHRNCFFSLASDLDLDYYYIQADVVSGNEHEGSFVINMEDLENVVKLIES